jgi:hypothetical protein
MSDLIVGIDLGTTLARGRQQDRLTSGRDFTWRGEMSARFSVPLSLQPQMVTGSVYKVLQESCGTGSPVEILSRNPGILCHHTTLIGCPRPRHLVESQHFIRQSFKTMG